MKTVELHYPMIQFLIISDIAQFRLGNIQLREVFNPIARERKDLMDYKLGYLSANIIPRGEQFSEETLSFEEQIMPKDKYLRIFSRQMEAFVFIILLKIGVIFGHVTCLDQSRANEYI